MTEWGAYSDTLVVSKVTLLGGVPADAVKKLWVQLTGGPMPFLELVKSPNLAKLNELSMPWATPLQSWWLPELRPRLELGDFGAVATGSGSRLQVSLVGKLIATQQLS